MRNDIKAINEAYETATNGSSKKLYFNDIELNIGDLLTDEMSGGDTDFETGIIVGIRYPDVYVKEFNANDYTEGEEGWTVSEDNGNMGALMWR